MEPRTQRSWQRFSYTWRPDRAGSHELAGRCTDTQDRAQAATGARNAVYSFTVDLSA